MPRQRLTHSATSPDAETVTGPNHLVSPVRRIIRLLHYVAAGGSTANLMHTARQLQMNRITLARLLNTLEHERVLERLPDGNHRLGVSFLGLASTALATRDLFQVARPILSHLAHTLKTSAYLGVLDDGDVLYLLREMPDTPLVSYIEVGSKVAAHLTTAGRMLLAFRPEDEVRALLGPEPLPAATDKTPTTYRALNLQLQTDRINGCAWSLSAFEPGINSCAAPVMGSSGEIIAAISLNGPATHFNPDGTSRHFIESSLKENAEKLSRLMGYVPRRDVSRHALPKQDSVG